ncbi:MAG TPA: hypothetical protein VFH03_10320 [Actinoplanes sp.]|nr:hypothetical protein [Actinoplanes sp.]
MRSRIGSTLAALVATAGLAAGVAGPVYSAFGGDSGKTTTTTSVQAGRAMLFSGGTATTQGRAM